MKIGHGLLLVSACLLGQVDRAKGFLKVDDMEPVNAKMSICDQSSDDNSLCGNLTYVKMAKGNLIYAPIAPEDGEEFSVCTGDYVFPLLPGEPLWSDGVRTVFYFLLLVWCFLGVAIISDHFMAAIEVITAKERVIIIQNEVGEAEEKKVLVWNETIANLSLMALGSSAPEILLSVVETVFSLEKPPEDGLGASTIVGSAAFNLLVITAVCMIAIPDGQSRSIEEYGVFGITSFSSVWAYLWLYLVLMDEIVTIPEALATFFMFPLLLFVSWAQTKSWWGLCGSRGDNKVKPEGHIIAIDGGNHGSLGDRKRFKSESQGEDAVVVTEDEARDHVAPLQTTASGRVITIAEKQKAQLAEMLHRLPNDLSEEDMAKLAASNILNQDHHVSNLRYRIDARRKMVGAKGVIRKKLEFVKKHTIRRLSAVSSTMSSRKASISKHQYLIEPIVSFTSHSYSVNENDGEIKIPVIRMGTPSLLQKESRVCYETRSGTARGGEDFEHSSGELVFESGETRKEITVKIIDDTQYEGNETFTVLLSLPQLVEGGPTPNVDLDSAEFSLCEVTIIDDDHPGIFGFENGHMVVKESDGKARIIVRRTNGIANKIVVAYKTIESTAKAGLDFFHTQGTLMFDHGACEASFDVVLIDSKRYDKDASFGVELQIIDHPECGAEYGEHKILSVTITNDDRYTATVDRVAELMQIHLENAEVGTSSWMEQIKDALTVQGEDGEDPGPMDIFMHIITFGWKVLFALVPPTSYYGGWLSFGMSLLFIGVLTAAVGDIAKVFGCLLGVPNPLTAITFVALGTSLPDTFASKTAAESDPNADNSIGNITGSNSVNVFLGLGLPWCIGAFYKFAQGKEFFVSAKGLSFSVVVFCSIAAVYFTMMISRRQLGYGELGGPKVPKYLSCALLIALWFTYIGVSAVQMLAEASK